jgi:hypothetical protein
MSGLPSLAIGHQNRPVPRDEVPRSAAYGQAEDTGEEVPVVVAAVIGGIGLLAGLLSAAQGPPTRIVVR